MNIIFLNSYLSFESRIEQDLLDAAISVLLGKRQPPQVWREYQYRRIQKTIMKDSADGTHGIEVCFAFVFLVKLSKVHQHLRNQLTRRIASYKRPWFKGLLIHKINLKINIDVSWAPINIYLSIILANILNMVIREMETAEDLNKMLRDSPTLLAIMMDDCDAQSTGCWVDWFREENFKKVCEISRDVTRF